EVPKLLGTKRKFARHGRSGAWVSECFPHVAQVVDNLAIVRSLVTDVFNHAPAKIFMNTGSAQFGPPSMGSWVTYGLGSESRELPGLVGLRRGPRGRRGGGAGGPSGFRPPPSRAGPSRPGGEPILTLSTPQGVTPARQRLAVEAIRDLNAARLA